MAHFILWRSEGAIFVLLRRILSVVAVALGCAERLDVRPGAPLASAANELPVVIFSHGLGGNRSLYSVYCGELASQGYVVLAGAGALAALPGGAVGRAPV